MKVFVVVERTEEEEEDDNILFVATGTKEEIRKKIKKYLQDLNMEPVCDTDEEADKITLKELQRHGNCGYWFWDNSNYRFISLYPNNIEEELSVIDVIEMELEER